MMLRVARRYDDNSGTILFANNQTYSSERYSHIGIGHIADDLLHFCRALYSLDVDNVEYALITAIVIFSDRPGLEKVELVELIQSYYIETLRVYIINRYGGAATCTIQFAKLLGILTELRTLGNKNSEMCFSLKLRNKRLPKFLEEVWDVPELGSENNTATTNTESIVRDKLNRETANRADY
jgi:ecdysone receptor